MKKIIFISILLLSFWACSSRPEPNLQLSNPDAFAFDLGDSWEVNASVKATGFAQVEKDDDYLAKLSFSVDLITPNSDSLSAVFNEIVDEKDIEEFSDFILEAQIEVDNAFGLGDYKLVFNVKDEYSDQTKSISVDFNLSK
jgi:hypothetical protein